MIDNPHKRIFRLLSTVLNSTSQVYVSAVDRLKKRSFAR